MACLSGSGGRYILVLEYIRVAGRHGAGWMNPCLSLNSCLDFTRKFTMVLLLFFLIFSQVGGQESSRKDPAAPASRRRGRTRTRTRRRRPRTAAVSAVGQADTHKYNINRHHAMLCVIFTYVGTQ